MNVTGSNMRGRAKWRLSPAQQQVLAAALALGLGLLIYLLTRPHDRIILFSVLPRLDALPHWSGSALLQWLPSALHTYAFILLTNSLWSNRPEMLSRVCLFWVFLEMLMELGQQQDLALEIANRLPNWFHDSPMLRVLPNYFLNGRYDPMDQMFVLLGALAACATVLIFRSIVPMHRIGKN